MDHRGNIWIWRLAVTLWAAWSPFGGGWSAEGQGFDLGVDALAAGPYSEMTMTLQKGLLFVHVEVAHVRVRFGPETAAELRELTAGKDPSESLADSVALAAIRSSDAFIEVRFLRDVGLDRFVSEARQAASRVRKQGLISESAYRRIRQNLPFWYRGLENRGILEGDVLNYRIEEDQLRTVFQADDGTVLVNQVDQERETAVTVLGGYFVKGSDFREGLLDSFFQSSGDPSLQPSR